MARGLSQQLRVVLPRAQVGEDQQARAGPGGEPAGVRRGEVPAPQWASYPGRFREQHLATCGQLVEGRARGAVARVAESVIDPECATCDATEAIWSTPRSAENHARRLVRFVTKHLHDEEG